MKSIFLGLCVFFACSAYAMDDAGFEQYSKEQLAIREYPKLKKSITALTDLFSEFSTFGIPNRVAIVKIEGELQSDGMHPDLAWSVRPIVGLLKTQFDKRESLAEENTQLKQQLINSQEEVERLASSRIVMGRDTRRMLLKQFVIVGSLCFLMGICAKYVFDHCREKYEESPTHIQDKEPALDEI